MKCCYKGFTSHTSHIERDIINYHPVNHNGRHYCCENNILKLIFWHNKIPPYDKMIQTTCVAAIASCVVRYHPNHPKGIVRFQYAVTYTATIFHCCAILPHFFCSCKCFFLFFFDLRYFPCFAHFLLESFQFFYKTARCHSIFIFKCPMKIRQIVKAYRQGDFQNRCIALLK